jgi:hypothetical protein
MDSAPDHAQAFGRLMAHWAIAELNFAEILAALLRTDKVRARMIYLQFVALGPKCDLAKRLAYAYVAESKEREQMITLIQDFLDMSNVRNMYAHAIWAYGEGDDEDSLTIIHGTPPPPKLPFKDPVTVTVATLKADIAKIEGLASRSHEFLLNVLPAMAVSEKVLT